MKKEREIAYVNRSLVGCFVVPGNPEHHPLLTDLYGGDASGYRAPLEMPLEEALKEVKEVAAGCGITVSVCGNRRSRPVLQLWRAPKPATTELNNIFATLGRSAAQWTLSDFYDAHAQALQAALATGEPFTTGWFSAKKEAQSGCITRRRPRGPIEVLVSTECDDPDDLTDTAVWEASGGSAFSTCGSDALDKLGLSGVSKEEFLAAQVAQVGPTQASAESTLHWRSGFARVLAELDKSVAFCDEETAMTYRDAVSRSKEALRKLRKQRSR